MTREVNELSAKALVIDTIKRVQDADDKLSPAALDILADILIDAIRKDEGR